MASSCSGDCEGGVGRRDFLLFFFVFVLVDAAGGGGRIVDEDGDEAGAEAAADAGDDGFAASSFISYHMSLLKGVLIQMR